MTDSALRSTVRRYRFLAVLLAAFSLLSHGLLAQTETGQITGTVLDQMNAAIPNVTITVTEAGTKVVRTTTSSGVGAYLFPNLLPGTYEINATAPNFQTVKQTVVLPVGTTLGVDLHLLVGSTTTIVEVQEKVVQINTQTQSVGQNVSSQEIADLPTITRNPYDLVKGVGNVAEGDPSGRGAGVAINGLRSSSTNMLLDGVANNDEFTATVGIKVPLDSVQEFSVLTSDYTAEYGRVGGGVINVATKNGTNEFHGTLYEFNRLSALTANTFDNNARGLPKSVFVRNQFGYSIGGPIIKNKLFFFQNTEWTRVRSSANTQGVIPTPQLIAASSPATQQFFSQYGGLGATTSILSTIPRSAVACTTPACLAIPANTPIYEQVSYSVPSDAGGGSPQNTSELVGRFDYNLSEKTQMYFRYARQYELDLTGSQFNSPYAGYNTSNLYANSGYALSVTHSFSSRAVDLTKISYNRLDNEQPLGSNPPGPTLFTTLNSTSSIGGVQILYPGYGPFTPGNAVPFGGPQNFEAISNDFSYTWGKHTFRLGGEYTYFQDNRTFGAYENAVEALGTNVPTALNGFITGQLHAFQAAINPQGKFPCVGGVVTPACTVNLPVGFPNFSRSNLFHEAALYLQDSWKATARLTFNFGLRWEYFGPPIDRNHSLTSNFYPGAGSNIETQAGTGVVLQVPNSPIQGAWKQQWGNVGPRLGFAWDVFGDGKTSLRGGYGIAYERNFNNVTFNMMFNPPNYALVSLVAGTDLPTIALSANNAGPLAGSNGSKGIPPTSLRAIDPNIKTAYAHLWSASLEHQLSNDAIVGVDYTGSAGQDLYTINQLNEPGSASVYGTDAAGLGRINPQYSTINFRTNAGSSFYEALNLRLELRNLRKYGLTARVNYTWAHSIDDNSSTFTSDSTQAWYNGVLDPLNPALDRGDSDFDNRHRITMTAIWDEPFFKSKGMMNRIAGGWSLAPIFSAHTGVPFTVYDCSNADSACPRIMFDSKFSPQYTDVATSNPNEFNYLNLATGNIDSSYVNAKAGVSDFGPFPSTMTGRNAFRTPGDWTLNFAVHKTFSLTERFKLQLRGEFYDLFNHSNLYVVYTNNEVSSFPGAPIITATRGINNNSTFTGNSVENGRLEARNVQLALKLIF